MSPDASPESSWHAIRPWAPTLSLAVHEITSVSATFILSCGEIDTSLASLGLEAADEESEINDESLPPAKSSVVADALARGLSVNVNGSAWPRAFIRIDDQLDEAVIIIYALMPGRQYDIELGLAPAGQIITATTMRRQITTEEDSDRDTCEVHTDLDSQTPDNSTASDTPSTSPSGTVPGTPPTTTPQLTLEDRLNQLQHTLSLVNAERETLLASLKAARREAQKADSALRSEIDTLKRTSEKNTAAELRGKQKIRALQEAVKRAQNAAIELDGQTDEMKKAEPDLTSQQQEKEAEYSKIEQEATRVHKEREDIEEKERKRLEMMRAELTSLTSKLEKLNGKREKLEGTAIPELEDKLKEVEREIEQETPLYRLHQQVNMARSSLPPPIQRPPQVDSSPIWSPPRSHTYQAQRRGSLKATLSTPSPASLPLSKSSPTTPPVTSSPTHNTSGPMQSTGSTLSSRAPAFEPSRPLGTLKVFTGNTQPSVFSSTISVPIPRPPTQPVGSGRNNSTGAGIGAGKNGTLGHAHWASQGQQGQGYMYGHPHNGSNNHSSFDNAR